MSSRPDCLDDDTLTAMALGSLAPHEERSASQHIELCERCRARFSAYSPAVSVLAESVPQYEAPPEMRERVMEIVRDEAGARAEGAVPRIPRGILGFLLRPATGLAIAAVMLAGVGGYAISGGPGGPDRVVTADAALVGAAGSIEVEDDLATLKTTGFPQLPEGAVYQVWVQNGQVITPSGAFVPKDDGSAVAAVEISEDSDAVMVTREPHAGRTKPTLPTVLTADLS